jgi:ABC-type spermidine/putrescine transport system permease subunit II
MEVLGMDMKRPNDLKMNKLLWVCYAGILTIMMCCLTYFLHWFLVEVPYLFEPAAIMPEIISGIPYLLMLEAIPLAIFAALFLKKGGGLSYFETWDTGRKLRFSGILLLLGYTTATLPAPIDLLTRSRFRIIDLRIIGIGSDYGYDPLYMIPIYIGLSLMLCGMVAFVYLSLTHHKKINE